MDTRSPSLARARELIERFRQSPPSAERRARASPWWQSSQSFAGGSLLRGTPAPVTPYSVDATALTHEWLSPSGDVSDRSDLVGPSSEERLRQLSAADFTTVEVLARARAVIASSKRLFDEPQPAPGQASSQASPETSFTYGPSSGVTGASPPKPALNPPPLLGRTRGAGSPSDSRRAPEHGLAFAASLTGSYASPDPLQDLSRIDANSSIDASSGYGISASFTLMTERGTAPTPQEVAAAAPPVAAPAPAGAGGPAPTEPPLYVSPEEILMESPQATLERLRRRFAAQDAEAAAGSAAALPRVAAPAPQAPVVPTPPLPAAITLPPPASRRASLTSAEGIKLDMATELADIDRVLAALKGAPQSTVKEGGTSTTAALAAVTAPRRASCIDVGVGTSLAVEQEVQPAVSVPTQTGATSTTAGEGTTAALPAPVTAPVAPVAPPSHRHTPPPLLYYDANLGAYLPLDPASVPAQLLLNATGIVTRQPAEQSKQLPVPTVEAAAVPEVLPAVAPSPEPAAHVPHSPPRVPPPAPIPPELEGPLPSEQATELLPAPSAVETTEVPPQSRSPPRPQASRPAPPPPPALPQALRALPSGALVTPDQAALLASLEEEPAFLALLQQARASAGK